MYLSVIYRALTNDNMHCLGMAVRNGNLLSASPIIILYLYSGSCVLNLVREN